MLLGRFVALNRQRSPWVRESPTDQRSAALAHACALDEFEDGRTRDANLLCNRSTSQSPRALNRSTSLRYAATFSGRPSLTPHRLARAKPALILSTATARLNSEIASSMSPKKRTPERRSKLTRLLSLRNSMGGRHRLTLPCARAQVSCVFGPAQLIIDPCPLGHCEARNCEIDKCLDEETGITEITGYCSSCERYWTQFKKGDKWIL